MNNTKNISSDKILFIASAITIIILLVLSVSKIIKIKETSSTIDKCNLALQNNKDRLNKLEALIDKKTDLENEYETLNNKIPTILDERQVIDYLYNYSEKNAVNLLSIDFGNEKENKKGNVIEIPLKLSFSGEYTSIVKLLEELNYGERLIRIDEIQMAGIGDMSKNINAVISAAAFYVNR